MNLEFESKLEQLANQMEVELSQLKEDIVYLRMCFNFAVLSKAQRLKVGEIILTQQGIPIPGRNGTAPKTSNECEFIDENTGNLVSHSHVICGLQNCVYKAAREGLSVVNGTGYSTHSPCVRCGPVILSVGLKRFVYCQEYRIIDHLEVLREQGVILHQIPLNIVNEFGDHYG